MKEWMSFDEKGDGFDETETTEELSNRNSACSSQNLNFLVPNQLKDFKSRLRSNFLPSLMTSSR